MDDSKAIKELIFNTKVELFNRIYEATFINDEGSIQRLLQELYKISDELEKEYLELDGN